MGKAFILKVGWTRLIMGSFLLALFIACPFVGVNVEFPINSVIGRFGMNLIIVLSLMPMIQAGCGLNFGSPLGVVCGIFGAVCSLELRLTGFAGILAAMLIGALMAAAVGFLYGQILNRVKGDEMIIATYIGLAFIAFMNLFWVQFLPVTNPILLLGYGGTGIRQAVTLEGYWSRGISDFLSFKIGSVVEIPTGMLLLCALCCVLMWLFFKSKLGTAMTAVGSNPEYARAAGISVDRVRLIATMMSTVIAAVGIIVYAQNYTMVTLYNAPRDFAFPAVAAILLGGAGINKAAVKNVLIGTFLFQGIIMVFPMVVSSVMDEISEAVRLIISNGLILIALTRKERRG